MSARFHPSDETLLRYAAGTLDAGLRIVVASHLEICPACRAHIADLEAVGGQLLTEMPAAALETASPERLLERAAVWRPSQPFTVGASRPLEGLAPPLALRGCEVGDWRTVAPGVRVSRVRVPGHPQARVILLRARAGRRMPAHSHTAFEFTQVLTGSFSDNGNRYAPGDFVEGDVDTDHSPVIGEESECISLAAITGQIRFHGALGRLLQPFVGI